MLSQTLSIYGNIDHIDFFGKSPPFAFVKYKQVKDAHKAMENQQTIALLIGKIEVKISFSDHEKVGVYSKATERGG